MSEEKIIGIIDEIAETAKEAVKRGFFDEPATVPKVKYFADFTTEELKQVAERWDEAGESMSKAFRDLEESAQELLGLCEFEDAVKRNHALYDKGMKKYGRPSLSIGDEIVFIGNGCAVKDRISKVLVETENGYQVYVDDAFHTMTELVEHLKENVHG